MDKLRMLTPEQIAALNPDQIAAIINSTSNYDGDVAIMKLFVREYGTHEGTYDTAGDKANLKRFCNLLCKYESDKFYITTKLHIDNYSKKCEVLPIELMTEAEAKEQYPLIDKFIHMPSTSAPAGQFISKFHYSGCPLIIIQPCVIQMYDYMNLNNIKLTRAN